MRKRSSKKPVESEPASAASAPAKNPAAVALGKLGGAKGGKTRMQTMSKKERQELARHAAQTRWAARIKP